MSQYQFRKDIDPMTVYDMIEALLLQIKPLENQLEHADLKRLMREELTPYQAYMLGASRIERTQDLLTEIVKNNSKKS